MEYISAEEFLKQSKEVQEAFWNWWKCEKGDINYSPIRRGVEIVEIENNSIQRRNNGYIPLLTEGQLRGFIEDKTGYKVELNYYIETGYDVSLTDGKINYYNHYVDLDTDLLQSYWKVAIEIAKEQIQ
ncbi:MAG: hypothetical protein E7208_03765 [Clostridium butyricum]|nr:hypothetical protein [Clostridium butyricum]